MKALRQQKNTAQGTRNLFDIGKKISSVLALIKFYLAKGPDKSFEKEQSSRYRVLEKTKVSLIFIATKLKKQILPLIKFV